MYVIHKNSCMNQTNFDNYKHIKNKFDYIYKGYNLKFLVPGYLGFIFSGDSLSLRDMVKEFYTGKQAIDPTRVFDAKADTLISYLIHRTDYRDLALAAQSLYPNSEVVNLSELPKVNFSIFGLTYIKHFWLALWLVFSRSIGNGFVTRLFLVALSIRIMNQISLVEKRANVAHIKHYICFNSAYKEEAVLTACFNKRRVETITMQHGIFCDFKIQIAFDIINHENMIAQKLLCWGQSTIDYMLTRGMDESQFILVGNLKYKDVTIEAINQNFKACLVLLGRGNYIDTNNKLLAMLLNYNELHNNQIVFYIKKHPFLMDEEHKQYANISKNMVFVGREHSAQEVLRSDLVDFSISVNTMAYYESLVLSKPCLRWVESENEEFYGMDDKFASMEEFEAKIDALKNRDAEAIQKEVKSIIKYIFNPNLSI